MMKFIIAFILLVILQPLPKESMERGKKVYDKYCITCHMQDGAGIPGLNPPLIKTTYVIGDKKIIIGIILKGLEGEVEIDGEYFQNAMAPHDYLSDEQIADVATFVRNSFGNKASPVFSKEVKSLRSEIKKLP
jgi:mono/diheme cytochrome c family protein